MTLDLLLNLLLRPATPRDKWLRAVITGVGAALALVIAILLFAAGGSDDENGSGNAGTILNVMSPAASNWEPVTGHVTEVRQDDKRDDEGTVTATFWFVKYEYYVGEDYYIREAQVASSYAVGDAVTVYYSPDDNGTSTLIQPGTSAPTPVVDASADTDDDGGGSTVGAIILLIVGGLLTALTIVQIVDLRRDAMGPDA